MTKRVVVLFDGTWNNKRDRTNVIRMRESIASSGKNDPVQPSFYESGVGTHWYDRLTGGVFGRGLSRNIRQGYAWLCEEHVSGDDIFIFGFSRGAYTARSLAGLIRKCGLLNSPAPELVEHAYELYRRKDASADSSDAVTFRGLHSREVRVRFIGVWDTVGALGIPVSHVPFSRDYYRFHDTELSKIVDYAYQAMAVDEHRKDYAPTVWTRIKPENREVEQRWFIGAHSNVGGGYGNDLLPNLPLRWMQDKAEAAGLLLRDKCAVGSDEHLAAIGNSYAEFIFGVYKIFSARFDRPFGLGVNEKVHDSVWQRSKALSGYRPRTLQAHPDRPTMP
ncbi:MAG: DUF2235 domain-containing protein [Chromatiales bacterium]